MRSAVVVGSGRSGTSLVTGLLADAGLNLGDELLPPSVANRTGYQEDPRVNALNDEFLAPLLGPEHRFTGTRLAWLAVLPDSAEPAADAAQVRAMRRYLPAVPFCLKDPRLSYTIDCWQPVLGTARRVAVFRHPSSVVRSIQRDIERDPAYYAGFRFTPEHGFRMWNAMNRRILRRTQAEANWLLVDSDQLLASGDVTALADHIGTAVPTDRFDPGAFGGVDPTGTPADSCRLHAEMVAWAARGR